MRNIPLGNREPWEVLEQGWAGCECKVRWQYADGGPGAALSMWLRGGRGEERGASQEGDGVNVLQRSTEQKPVDVKAASSPASGPLSRGGASALQLVLPEPLGEVACNRAISTHKNSSSFRWGRPAVVSGARPGTEPKLQSHQQGQRHLGCPGQPPRGGMRNPLRELQGCTLTPWPQMTAYHSRGQSRQGDKPEAGLSHFRRQEQGQLVSLRWGWSLPGEIKR